MGFEIDLIELNHRYDTLVQALTARSAESCVALYLPPSVPHLRDSTKFFATLRLQKTSLTNKNPLTPKFRLMEFHPQR